VVRVRSVPLQLLTDANLSVQVIAPTYEQLASQYPNAVFLKVDVDRHKAIAAKYQVSAMPTFLVIKQSGVADMVRGADRHALEAMVSKHASAAAPAAPLHPTEAEKAKAEGSTQKLLTTIPVRSSWRRALLYFMEIAHSPISN